LCNHYISRRFVTDVLIFLFISLFLPTCTDQKGKIKHKITRSGKNKKKSLESIDSRDACLVAGVDPLSL